MGWSLACKGMRPAAVLAFGLNALVILHQVCIIDLAESISIARALALKNHYTLEPTQEIRAIVSPQHSPTPKLKPSLQHGPDMQLPRCILACCLPADTH